MRRLQRLKRTPLMRSLTADTTVKLDHLIQPLFAVEGLKEDENVPGLAGVKRQSIESLQKQVDCDLQKGVSQFLLFVIQQKKADRNLTFEFGQKVISGLKETFREDICLWVDTCLCSSTSHGHCCVFRGDGRADPAASTEELANMAAAFAEAGADGVAPSDMQDGRVAVIREKLNAAGKDLTPIMSYSTKFASNFYGPFRVAADSTPKFGDRKQYQLDFRNRSEAIAASVRCAEEGADLLMVKPGLTSLDLILPIHEITGRPVGAYQVSGEFASLHFLAENGLAKFEEALLETWFALRRGGAQFVITYGARLAKNLGL